MDCFCDDDLSTFRALVQIC